jgi:tRNA 2-thiouridine synthesizing protein A
MVPGPKGEKRPADVTGNAIHAMRIATGEAQQPGADVLKDKDIGTIERFRDVCLNRADKTVRVAARDVVARSNGGRTDAGMTEKTINLRGLKCPLPALRARKALSGMAAGDRLVVECTDPLAAIDIPNLVRETGDTLEDTLRVEDVLTFRIRKG